MQAILPNAHSRSRPYAWGMITVEPEPPRVGREASIRFPLANPGPDLVVVEQITVKVALFGIGVEWEEIGTLGPIHLEPEPGAVNTYAIAWTPTIGGHRCVRATLDVKGRDEPLIVGRNLHVIEASADEDVWLQPFQLGNPRPEATPIVLTLGGNHQNDLRGAVYVAGHEVTASQPVWLRGGEVVAAELVLMARTDDAIDAIRTLEASRGGELIDGIEIIVRRPARVALSARSASPGAAVVSLDEVKATVSGPVNR